jgi:hypothetical protein
MTYLVYSMMELPAFAFQGCINRGKFHQEKEETINSTLGYLASASLGPPVPVFGKS